MFKIKIDETLFRLKPDFRRGLIIAIGMQNTGVDPSLEALLRSSCQEAALSPIDLATDERVTKWTDTFSAYGWDIKRFAPAHLALLKRVQRPATSFPFINKVVAAMNLTSIQSVLPVGADDLTQVASLGKELELRTATGEESFLPLGKPEQNERPDPGEIILAVNGTVCCRRWCWRNGHLTRITEATTALVMNFDALGQDAEARVIAARDRAAKILNDYCHATTVTALLSPVYPELRINM